MQFMKKKNDKKFDKWKSDSNETFIEIFKFWFICLSLLLFLSHKEKKTYILRKHLLLKNCFSFYTRKVHKDVCIVLNWLITDKIITQSYTKLFNVNLSNDN